MTSLWHLRVIEKQQTIHASETTGPVELGRQSDTSEQPYSLQLLKTGGQRLVIARLQEDDVSRQHALVEPVAQDRIRLRNVSRKLSIGLADGTELKPLTMCELTLPVLLTLGRKTVRIEDARAETIELQSLAEVTRAPGMSSFPPSRLPDLIKPSSNLNLEGLLGWLQATMEVLQSATNSTDFFLKAAQAIVDLVGLDVGRVLLLNKDEWQVQAVQERSGPISEATWRPSRMVLSKVRQEKRTFWQVPNTAAEEAASLVGIKAIVVAPLLDRQGEVIGALYGDRRLDSVNAEASPITKLEALLVELLASGVAAGLARLQHEKAAVAARVQFEQFFTPELARQLELQPDLLQGRDCEVTLLFCDIRGFSAISERLGPARTCEWIGDILESLSECVLAHRGVVVDYLGDELMAMWGAPEQCADHAQLACRAALAMLDQIPTLNERWQSIVDRPLGLGIGINTGMARVGNTGTPRRFKYGPLGNTVNLASRVQGATKYLKCKLLATQATQARLGGDFAARRLCTVRVVNIAEPVSLYEVAAPGQADWTEIKTTYEKALEAFDAQQFRVAARTLAGLVAETVNDGPALVLMARAVNALVDGPANGHPVWELPGK